MGGGARTRAPPRLRTSNLIFYFSPHILLQPRARGAGGANHLHVTVGAMGTFRFEPRWKEELVCTGPGGSFVLFMPMGVLTVVLPSEESWRRQAPEWARALWPVLHRELVRWCRANRAGLQVDASAGVYADRTVRSDS